MMMVREDIGYSDNGILAFGYKRLKAPSLFFLLQHLTFDVHLKVITW